jgi:uncharacterized membrane protein (DUF2068 family)
MERRPADFNVRREPGLELILAYKLGKAALWTVLATVVGVLAVTGRIEQLRETAHDLREHLASRWSLAVADGAIALLSVKGIRIVEVGLAIDATLSALEGWALWHGHRWGPWLVVVASALPLPFELQHLAHRVSPSRLALVALNLAIIAYLLRWLRRHPKAHAPAAPPADPPAGPDAPP